MHVWKEIVKEMQTASSPAALKLLKKTLLLVENI